MTTVVMPCETCEAADGSVVKPRSEWLWASMKPGASTSPRASITRASDGTLTWPRRPTATIESPLMTTAEFLMGARPEPSIRVAPRMTIVVTSCNMGHRLTLIGYGLPILVLWFVGLDVVFQFLRIGVVGFLFQKLLVLDYGFIFHSDRVVERCQAQMCIGFADGIELDCLVEITNCLRTFLDLQVRLAETIVRIGRRGLNVHGHIQRLDRALVVFFHHAQPAELHKGQEKLWPAVDCV